MPGSSSVSPELLERVRENFSRQHVMHLIGAQLTRIEMGLAEIELPFRDELVQQHGYIHAGIATTIADSAGGYAAYTLMPPNSSVLTVEYKLNFLTPAQGEKLLARARAVRPGRTLTVCELEVFSVRDGRPERSAWGIQTVMRVEGSSNPREAKRVPGAPRGPRGA